MAGSGWAVRTGARRAGSDRSPAVGASPSPARPCDGASIGQSSRRQAGSATLIALALTVFVMGAGTMALDVGLLVVARARTQTAADLAALAALTPGVGPGASQGRRSGPASPIGNGGPAAGAAAVADANGAELVACACGPTEAVVTVRRRVRMLPAGMLLSMTARARAVLPGLDGPEPARRGGAPPHRGSARPAAPRRGRWDARRPSRADQTSGTRWGPARGVAWS